MKKFISIVVFAIALPVMAEFIDPNDIPTCPNNVPNCDGVPSPSDLDTCITRALHSYNHDVEDCKSVPSLGRKTCLNIARSVYMTKVRECRFIYG